MRELTDHIVEGSLLADNIKIEVLDEPGAGNANHVYQVSGVGVYGTIGIGTTIEFQNGPIKENGVNGLTHEALLAILIDRMRGFQSGPYKCRENAIVLTNLEESLMWLQKRTRDRMFRGVEGTHAI